MDEFLITTQQILQKNLDSFLCPSADRSRCAQTFCTALREENLYCLQYWQYQIENIIQECSWTEL